MYAWARTEVVQRGISSLAGSTGGGQGAKVLNLGHHPSGDGVAVGKVFDECSDVACPQHEKFLLIGNVKRDLVSQLSDILMTVVKNLLKSRSIVASDVFDELIAFVVQAEEKILHVGDAGHEVGDAGLHRSHVGGQSLVTDLPDRELRRPLVKLWVMLSPSVNGQDKGVQSLLIGF